MTFESRTIRVDGAATHYLQGGKPDGETVVLIHDGGFGADGWVSWNPLMHLLGERYQVFAPDMLGFGKTSKVYDFGQGARGQKIGHLAGWMREVGIRDAHVVGNSNGGSLVLFAAMRNEWPMARAVSIAGTGGPFMRGENYGPLRKYIPDREAMRQIMELMIGRRDAVLEELVEERYQRSLIRGHWENLSAPRLKPPAPKGAEGAEDNQRFFADLGKISIPTLLIAGADDPLLEAGWETQLACHIRGARTLVVAGARHQPQIDRPEAVREAIEGFLGA
jgi:pimeloyl-ACP methyl ester carboxylesterase